MVSDVEPKQFKIIILLSKYQIVCEVIKTKGYKVKTQPFDW